METRGSSVEQAALSDRSLKLCLANYIAQITKVEQISRSGPTGMCLSIKSTDYVRVFYRTLNPQQHFLSRIKKSRLQFKGVLKFTAKKWAVGKYEDVLD